MFHEELSQQAGMIPPLLPWPGRAEQLASASQKQLC
ncbi:MAG: hypothetical protein ACI9G1_000663 [Pirellulaceae bacterium]|jgi:hypothetical protein